MIILVAIIFSLDTNPAYITHIQNVSTSSQGVTVSAYILAACFSQEQILHQVTFSLSEIRQLSRVTVENMDFH